MHTHAHEQGAYSANDISPSLSVSKSIKNSEGEQSNWPGIFSPFRYPPRTLDASDGGNTGTTARIKSAGVINTSPEGDRKDAKYSNTWKRKHEEDVIGNKT